MYLDLTTIEMEKTGSLPTDNNSNLPCTEYLKLLLNSERTSKYGHQDFSCREFVF